MLLLLVDATLKSLRSIALVELTGPLLVLLLPRIVIREGDPKGWSTVMSIALGRCGKPVSRGYTNC
jgi:hypothetical protein